MPSSIFCRRRSKCRRSRASIPKTEEEVDAQVVGRGAAVDARLQGDERPLRRLADLLPHLFGQARDRHRAFSTRSRTSASASAACCRCIRTIARTSRKPSPATSSPSPASRKSRTGDTLCDPANPVILERMEFPEPVIEIAIEPKTKGDQEKMGVALNRLAQEDPSFRVKTDQESRPDDHRRHGRAASRHHRRSHAPRVQGRGQCRRAAGRLSRDDHQVDAEATTPTRSRPAARASSPGSRSRSRRASRARASCSSRRSSAATCRRNTSPASRRASRAS